MLLGACHRTSPGDRMTGRQALHPHGWPRPDPRLAVMVPQVRAVKGLPRVPAASMSPWIPSSPGSGSLLGKHGGLSPHSVIFWTTIPPVLPPALEAGRSASSPWSLMRLRAGACVCGVTQRGAPPAPDSRSIHLHHTGDIAPCLEPEGARGHCAGGPWGYVCVGGELGSYVAVWLRCMACPILQMTTLSLRCGGWFSSRPPGRWGPGVEPQR